MSNELATPHLPNASLSPLSSRALLSCHQPLGGSYHLQVRGQAPRVALGPSLLPHRSCLYNCLLFRGCAKHLPPLAGVYPRSRDGTCAHTSQGPTHLCAGRLSPPTKLVCTVCVNVSITKYRWCLQCRFLFFFFCSNGWCAFYDFREVFLCSRKCKFYA